VKSGKMNVMMKTKDLWRRIAGYGHNQRTLPPAAGRLRLRISSYAAAFGWRIASDAAGRVRAVRATDEAVAANLTAGRAISRADPALSLPVLRVIEERACARRALGELH
jgi:hypothetical protein